MADNKILHVHQEAIILVCLMFRSPIAAWYTFIRKTPGYSIPWCTRQMCYFGKCAKNPLFVAEWAQVYTDLIYFSNNSQQNCSKLAVNVLAIRCIQLMTEHT